MGRALHLPTETTPINFLAFPGLHQSLPLTVSMSAGGLLQTWDTATVHYLRTRETWVTIRNEVVHGGLTEDLRARQVRRGGGVTWCKQLI